jgi:hypothetical protein
MNLILIHEKQWKFCTLAKFEFIIMWNHSILGLISGFTSTTYALAWAELAAVRSAALSMKYWGACVSAPQGNPHVIKKHTARQTSHCTAKYQVSIARASLIKPAVAEGVDSWCSKIMHGPRAKWVGLICIIRARCTRAARISLYVYTMHTIWELYSPQTCVETKQPLFGQLTRPQFTVMNSHATTESQRGMRGASQYNIIAKHSRLLPRREQLF